MGRKLRFSETNVFAADDEQLVHGAVADPECHRNALQARIAEALGISVEALNQAYDQPDRRQEAGDPLETGSTSFSHDCSVLLQAFAAIGDPEERKRLLAMVQAASRKPRTGDLS